jgi:hypothetical protein
MKRFNNFLTEAKGLPKQMTDLQIRRERSPEYLDGAEAGFESYERNKMAPLAQDSVAMSHWKKHNFSSKWAPGFNDAKIDANRMKATGDSSLDAIFKDRKSSFPGMQAKVREKLGNKAISGHAHDWQQIAREDIEVSGEVAKGSEVAMLRLAYHFRKGTVAHLHADMWEYKH